MRASTCAARRTSGSVESRKSIITDPDAVSVFALAGVPGGEQVGVDQRRRHDPGDLLRCPPEPLPEVDVARPGRPNHAVPAQERKGDLLDVKRERRGTQVRVEEAGSGLPSNLDARLQ